MKTTQGLRFYVAIFCGRSELNDLAYNPNICIVKIFQRVQWPGFCQQEFVCGGLIDHTNIMCHLDCGKNDICV